MHQSYERVVECNLIISVHLSPNFFVHDETYHETIYELDSKSYEAMYQTSLLIPPYHKIVHFTN